MALSRSFSHIFTSIVPMISHYTSSLFTHHIFCEVNPSSLTNKYALLTSLIQSLSSFLSFLIKLSCISSNTISFSPFLLISFIFRVRVQSLLLKTPLPISRFEATLYLSTISFNFSPPVYFALSC